MKRAAEKIIVAIALCALLCLGLGSCGVLKKDRTGEEEHTHVASVVWEHDASEHYKICSECGKKFNAAAHVFNENSVCSVCGQRLQSGDFIFLAYENGYVISAVEQNVKLSSVLSIPSTFENKPILGVLEGAFAGVTGIRTLTVGNQCTFIETGAFAGMPDLVNLTVGDNVRTVGANAFAACAKLRQVTLGRGILSIGDAAFLGCPIRTLTIRNLTGWCSVERDDAFSHPIDADEVIFEELATPDELIIPSGVKEIRKGAFAYLKGFRLLTLPTSVKTIAESAFASTDLTSVTFPQNGVRTIGSRAFEQCNLLSVSLPDCLAEIGEGAFDDNYSLSSLRFGSGLTHSPRIACDGKTLSALSVSSAHPKYASINNCIYDKDTAALIMGCSTSKIPKDGTIRKIAAGAFENSLYLTDFSVPDVVEEIESRAFKDCKGLYRVELGIGLKTLAADAFDGCQKLVQVFNRSSIPLSPLNPYCEISKFGEFGNSVSVDPASGALLFSSGGERYIFGLQADTAVANLRSVSAQAIFPYAFSCYPRLEEISLPSVLRTVGESAFENCFGLKTVNLPGGADEIGAYAFRNCDRLAAIDLSNVRERIKLGAFQNCDGLATVRCGAQTVEEGAFDAKGILSFTFTERLSKLEKNALSIQSPLTELIYEGTAAQWKQVQKTSASFLCNFTGELYIRCSDETVRI